MIGPGIDDVCCAVGIRYEYEWGTAKVCIRVGIIGGNWIGNIVKVAVNISTIVNCGVNVLSLTEIIIRGISLY